MKKGYCIHYSGIQKNECEAGYKYLSVARVLNQDEIQLHNTHYKHLATTHTAIIKRIPCIERNNVGGCSGYRLPTQEEVEQYEEKMDKFVSLFIDRVSVVRPAIIEDISNQYALNLSISGLIQCPICESGNIQYAYAGSYNKHIRATCSTPDCVQWIE